MADLLRRLRNAARVASTLGPGRAVAKTATALRRGGPREVTRLVRNIWNNVSPRPVPGEPDRDRNDYDEWVRRYDTLQPGDLQQMAEEIAGWAARPLISVVVPTYNPRREWLIEAIESVRAQAYDNWELCIADDASTQPHVREVLEEFARTDPRIRVTFRPRNGHICATSNSALELASGEWMCLLDHDDRLPVHALYWLAKTAIELPRVRMIYSDEDKISENGRRFGAYFKCDWNPDLFRSQNMFSHLGAFDLALVRQAGGFRPGLEGSQDYDLALRCMEHLERDQVAHVPRVLYHWRVHEDSTARSNDAKPYAQVAAERALNEHLDRTGQRARASATGSGYRVQYALPIPAPRVGIVVTGTAARRRRNEALAAVLATEYPDFRVYVANHGVKVADARVRNIFRDDDGQAYLAAIERLRADGCTVVCLVDAAGSPSSAAWLGEMASQCLRPEIGVVGARLADRRGRILSGGVVRLDGRLVDVHAGYPSESHGYGGRCQLVQLTSFARAACVAMRLEVYDDVVPPGELAHADAGMALCARAAARGLEVLWTPHAEFQFKVALAPLPVSPGGSEQPCDRAYNPNLHLAEADFSLAWPPLVTPSGPGPSGSTP
jgi:hypothetical protein